MKMSDTFRGIMASFLCLFCTITYAQNSFDNPTRATYIFDMARYIDYGEDFADSSVFKIGVLDKYSELLWEMGNLARTRGTIQGKPIQVVAFRSEDKINHTQILYVNKESDFDLKKVKNIIAGHKTMLITEGYAFRESMINFVTVNGKPRFEANEELIRESGMKVDADFLFLAVKSREDWENLFTITDADLQVHKETVKVQQEEIMLQEQEILRQKHLLDSLDNEISDKEAMLNEKQRVLESQLAQLAKNEKEINIHRNTIYAQQQEVKTQQDTLAAQKAMIAEQLSLIDGQLQKIGEQDDKIKIQLATLEKQNIIICFVLLALLLAIGLGYYIYRGYKIKKEANVRLEEKNKTISEQKDEIEQQRDIASAQRDQIAYQKKHITDSIMYAKRIQTALIPSLELFSDKLDHFVLYKPLSIVSGDFYWVGTEGDKQIIIAADCTGHGVPGAFMSMLGVTMLNDIVHKKCIVMPDEILNNLREGIVSTLNQIADSESVKDGMDMAVCTFDFKENTLWFAGANNPLYMIRNGELTHFRADKMPVAVYYKMTPFTRHEISVEKGDSFYIFSDGFADQFGGPNGKKFMTSQLKQKLLEIYDQPMIKQGELLNDTFVTWQGDSPQVDDVTLIGIRY